MVLQLLYINMSTMEKWEMILTKAIEGGYRKVSPFFTSSVSDKFFWQALSEICGWSTEEKEMQAFDSGACCGKLSYVPAQYVPYKYYYILFHTKHIEENWESAIEWLYDLINDDLSVYNEINCRMDLPRGASD